MIIVVDGRVFTNTDISYFKGYLHTQITLLQIRNNVICVQVVIYFLHYFLSHEVMSLAFHVCDFVIIACFLLSVYSWVTYGRIIIVFASV